MYHLSVIQVLFLVLMFQSGVLAADQVTPIAENVEAKSQGSKPVRMACNVFPPQKIALPGETDFPGYDLELIQSAFLAQGLTTEFGFFPWKRAYLLVKSGEYDALCSCSWLPEREADFLYSEEMGRVSKGVFTQDGKIYAQLSDLRGKVVGVVSGYNLEDELRAAGIFDIQSVISDALLLNLLHYKRVDAIYSYENTIRVHMQKKKWQDAINYTELESAPYYLCVSRALSDGQAILNKFNLGLQQLRDKGIYDQILKRYLAY